MIAKKLSPAVARAFIALLGIALVALICLLSCSPQPEKIGGSYPTPAGYGVPVVANGHYNTTALAGTASQFLQWDGGASGGPQWSTPKALSSYGVSGSRPSATGSGAFYFLTDAPIAYFDDPGSVAWKQFPFPTFTSTAPTAASYTVVGSIALVQVADAVSAVTTSNSPSNASVAIVAGSLGSSSTWVVTLKIEFMPGWNLQYPNWGVVVADGTSSGVSNVYGTDCGSNAATIGAYICHQERSTMAGARVSVSTDIQLTQHYGGTAGIMYARILADGVNSHYQLSNNGVRWESVNVAATPASLSQYGFLLGNPFTSTNAYSQAWVLENSLHALTLAQSTVTAATNATPIVVTTSAAHGLASGDLVAIHGVVGNTAANTTTGSSATAGAYLANVLTPTTFQLVGIAGNGAYSSGGTVTLVSR